MPFTKNILKSCITLLFLFYFISANSQLFQDDFGTFFSAINTTNWPGSCRSGASSFNSSTGPCAGSGDFSYNLVGFTYITTSAISIPSTGYELTFNYSFNQTFGFPTIEIRSGASCGTSISNTVILANTSGSCDPQTINLDDYVGQTIYVRFKSNSSLATFGLDDTKVDVSGGNGGSTLLTENFGSSFSSIDVANWPIACRNGASSFNNSSGSCAGSGDFGYTLNGFGNYITTKSLEIPSSGYDLNFEYAFNNTFGFPTIEIRTSGSCGTSLLNTITLANTSGACNVQTVNLNSYAGQAIYFRFRANTSSATLNFDEVNVFKAVLPIELLEFTAAPNDNFVLLEWSTASETNNNHFELQRSDNGTDFYAIATIQGAGNSSDIRNYKYVDDLPLNGVSYYRLKQIDYDGAFSLSQLLSVTFENPNIYVYPNPVFDQLSIEHSLSSYFVIMILNSSGRTVKTITTEPSRVDVSDLSNGIYFLKLISPGKTSVRKFVKD